MSYQEEYYKLIENHIFYQLPEQGMIDYDERVALAILKNYQNKVLHNEYQYDEYNRYEEIKFNEILVNYKHNKSFWEKANIQDYLLNEDFRKQFPEISFQFLSDKDFLLKFFNDKKNKLILDSLNTLVPKEEFEILEKSFLLSKGAKADDLKKYEHDEDFIKEMLRKRPYLYEELSEDIKNKESIIHVYLEYEPSILSFPRERQNQLFYTWAKLHRNWDMKTIDQLDYDYLKPIMKKINKSNNELLMQKLLSRNINKYQEVIVDFFEQNKNITVFTKMIKEKPINDLSPILKNMDCTFYLQNWLNNYSYKQSDKFDNKMLEILKDYTHLKSEWKESFDFKLMNKINKNEAISFDLFREALDVQFRKLNEQKITYEKLETNMLQLKKYLSVDILKEMKLPNKNIVEYLQHMKFQENFLEKGIKEKKMKI